MYFYSVDSQLAFAGMLGFYLRQVSTKGPTPRILRAWNASHTFRITSQTGRKTLILNLKTKCFKYRQLFMSLVNLFPGGLTSTQPEGLSKGDTGRGSAQFQSKR